MKMLCPECESPMRIIRSRPLTKGLREYVGECTSPDCRAKAAMHLSLSHYLRPPESSVKDLIGEYLSNLSDTDLKQLTKQVKGNRESQGELF
jgi:hypothetical protein